MSRTVKHFSTRDIFKPTDQFLTRHVGTQGADKQQMLEAIGFNNLDELIDATVPESIRLHKPLQLDEPLSESEALKKLKDMMSKNKVNKSFIGMGYYETTTPGVILRNVRFHIYFYSIFKILSLHSIFRYWKTLDGILPTLLTKQKLPKVVYNRY